MYDGPRLSFLYSGSKFLAIEIGQDGHSHCLGERAGRFPK
jgi:hypothetical protein